MNQGNKNSKEALRTTVIKNLGEGKRIRTQERVRNCEKEKGEIKREKAI